MKSMIKVASFLLLKVILFESNVQFVIKVMLFLLMMTYIDKISYYTFFIVQNKYILINERTVREFI